MASDDDSSVQSSSSDEAKDFDILSPDSKVVLEQAEAFDNVEGVERSHIENMRCERQKLVEGGVPFSVAFSGGGMRAAAFQAGVLWRLAEEDRLKDVEYLVAVSGGGYISGAFASHLHAAVNDPGIGTPTRREDVRDWYLHVVARALVRMQYNAGNMVRDFCKNPFGWPRDGSGKLPRIFDLPILVGTLIYTICIGPVLALLLYVIPFVEFVNLFFGSAMRAGFCGPANSPANNPGLLETVAASFDILYKWNEFKLLRTSIIACSIMAFIAWLLGRLPCCGTRKLGGRHVAGRCRLTADGVMAFLVRATLLLLLLDIVIHLVVYVEIAIYNSSCRLNQHRLAWCLEYILTDGTVANNTMLKCETFRDGMPWYGQPDIELSHWSEWVNVSTAGTMKWSPHLHWTARELIPHWDCKGARENEGEFRNERLLPMVAFLLFMISVIALFLTPFFKRGLWLFISLVGPIFCICLIIILVRFRVYGPLTSHRLFGRHHWSYNTWYTCAKLSVVFMFFTTFFHHEMRSVFHTFYKSTLVSNFFHAGQDLSLTTVQRNPWCPFLLFTATVHDYRRPGTRNTLSEIFFSGFHIGGENTDFVRMQPWFTLGRCVSLTAAGCLDAISLGMADHKRMRFWLEILNLSWGDYVMFEDRYQKTRTWFNLYARWARRKGANEESCFYGRRRVWFLERLPSTLVFLAVSFFLATGLLDVAQRNETGCSFARWHFGIAIATTGLILMLSFLTSAWPCLDWLVYNPWIRQFHQATQFYYRGNRPPSLVYVTDGGLQDCTGLLQLIKRRCKHILLVLACADPDDEFRVLRNTIHMAKKEKLGFFFDPSDCRRPVKLLLEKFKRSETWRHLEFGIRFGWSFDEDADIGHIVIVKNRLPADLAGRYCRPLLTEGEVCGGKGCRERCRSFNEADMSTTDEEDVEEDANDLLGNLRESDLGGLGCCDCCHLLGCNCGRKFPHLEASGFLYLTPGIFSGLCRLGYSVSEGAVDVLLRRR